MSFDIIPWHVCESHYIKNVERDPAKIESLIKTADARVAHLASQSITAENASFIIEGYYEAIKELLTALLLSRGLRSSNHQCLISFFYKTYKQYEAEARFIARLSFLRNRLNYYGELIDPAFYEQHKVEIDKVIKLLKSLLFTMVPEKSAEPLFLYNSLTRKKEQFKPLKKGHVGMYTCGPTVYWYQHIGNLRTMLLNDFLKRVLLHKDYKVTQVMNVTDVDDKTIKATQKEGVSLQELTRRYEKVFFEHLAALNIIKPSHIIRATESIEIMVDLIQKLLKKKYAYQTADGIYFSIEKFKQYGELVQLEKVKKTKARVRADEYDKSKPQDFALWKFYAPEDGDVFWETALGKGRPGWHIECSAMSIKNLGERFDIHTGGSDLMFPHHTNEVAQSEAATGKKFVNYWVHGGMLVMKEGKMSKSLGNIVTLDDLTKEGYSPMHFRYLCLQTHYRKPLAFSFEQLDAAKNAFERLKRKVIELRKTNVKGKNKRDEYEPRFHAAINDDLNIPEALQVFLKTLDDEMFDSTQKLKLLEHFDSVLGLGVKEMQEVLVLVPQEVQKLIDARERLRKAKQWAEADILRQRILEKGYKLEDTAEGARVERA